MRKRISVSRKINFPEKAKFLISASDGHDRQRRSGPLGGELIKIDHLMVGLGDDLVDEVGADKSGASSNEYSHWVVCVKIYPQDRLTLGDYPSKRH